MGFFSGEITDDGYVPSKFHQLIWPKHASGNKVNGVGDSERHRPVQSYHKHHPFYPFGLAEQWFIHKCMYDFRISNWYFKHWITENIRRLGKVAKQKQEESPESWARLVKEKALTDEDVHAVGICRMNPEWVFADREIPRGEWVIMLGRRMDYDEFSKNMKGDFVS